MSDSSKDTEYNPFKLRENGNIFEQVYYKIFKMYDIPVTYVRENVIEPYRKKNRSVYYHRQFRHVPEVDECMENDQACLYEANVQFNRQLRVDREIVTILTKRLEDCGYHHPNNAEVFCGKELNDLLAAKENFFIKYAELGMRPDVRQAYMKQKHRMIWERRMAEGKKYPLPPL